MFNNLQWKFVFKKLNWNVFTQKIASDNKSFVSELMARKLNICFTS